MTPANHLDCEQGSQMWAELRCGIVTASRTRDAFNTTSKGVYTAERAKYQAEIVCEILTGQPYPHHVTKEMEWGRDQESFARAGYEMERDVLVETCGFVLHPVIPRFGASPDGLVGSDGLIQIKCPTTATHLSWLRAGTVPLEHTFQMTAEMACTARDWCDFVSFDPRMPEHLQLFVRRYDRNEKAIQSLEAEVEHFNREIDEIIAALPGKPQGVVLSMDQPNDDEVQF